MLGSGMSTLEDLTDDSFVKLVPKSSEYGPEAWRRFSQLTEGKKLIANIDQKEGNILHLRLIDPTDPNAADDPLACLNADLVREGELTKSGTWQKLIDRLRYPRQVMSICWSIPPNHQKD